MGINYGLLRDKLDSISEQRVKLYPKYIDFNAVLIGGILFGKPFHGGGNFKAYVSSSADAPVIAHGFGFKDVATVQDPEVIALTVTKDECERETVASFLGTYHIYAGRQDGLVLLVKEEE